MREISIRPRRIPGAEHHAVESVLIGAPSPRRRIELVVHESALLRGPIVRGDGMPYIVGPKGERISAPEEIRRDIRCVVGEDGHLSAFQLANPQRKVAAVTGCGNLGMNRGVLGRIGRRIYGVPGPAGLTFACNAEGKARIVDTAARGDGGWAISGPSLVRGGERRISDAESFADPRHRLLFAYVPVGEGGPRVDFGHDRLLADPDLYTAATRGEEVELSLDGERPEGREKGSFGAVRPEDLRRALEQKGYREGRSGDRGTFVLDSSGLRIRFLPGIYPHHVLILWPGGDLASFLVSGASNRAGVVIEELADDLASAGVEAALLLDNGGDVGCWDALARSFRIRPAEPDRERSWPLTACLVHHDPGSD